MGGFIPRSRLDAFDGNNRIAQKNYRLQIPREFLEETLRYMEDAVQNLVRDLVFNLDELGVSEWKDQKPKRVVIPASLSGQTIHHGVNGNLEHVTIVSCVAASGTLNPLSDHYSGFAASPG
jgi:hypothetical protein